MAVCDRCYVPPPPSCCLGMEGVRLGVSALTPHLCVGAWQVA